MVPVFQSLRRYFAALPPVKVQAPRHNTTGALPVQSILASLLNNNNEEGEEEANVPRAGDAEEEEEEYTYIREVLIRRPSPMPWFALLFHRHLLHCPAPSGGGGATTTEPAPAPVSEDTTASSPFVGEEGGGGGGGDGSIASTHCSSPAESPTCGDWRLLHSPPLMSDLPGARGATQSGAPPPGTAVATMRVKLPVLVKQPGVFGQGVLTR